MKLNILHLYPDLMSLYGEWANLAVLCRHIRRWGAEAEVAAAAPEDPLDLTGADLIYMGAGTEGAQKAALTALLPSRDGLKDILDQGAFALFTGSAMELLGASITDRAGKSWPALALAGFTTQETDRRAPGDVVAHSRLWEDPVVGFMNKCSITRGVDSPLFDRLSLGFGNEAEGGAEGYLSDMIMATHLTGPLLVKNPHVTELLVGQLFRAKGWEPPAQVLPLPYEQEAYRVTLQELTAREGGRT